MHERSLKRPYFDALYKNNPDPWGFKTSGYEMEKYAATCAALPNEHYKRAIEIGCSIGILTRMLAPYCDRLLGLDIAQAAVDQAAEHNADLNHVDIAVARFPQIELAAKYDLIILSEVLYYFDDTEIAKVAERVREIAAPTADIICVHWLGPTPDYPNNGDTAMDMFETVIKPTEVMLRDRQERYRIDVFRLSQTV